MVFPYLETAISFALVMLVASLMVNVIVRILYTLRGQRAQGVSDMLRQLHRGYCRERGIVLRGTARTNAEDAFVNDVLGSPILHDGRTWEAAEAIYDRGLTAAAAAWKKAGVGGDKSKEAVLSLPADSDAAKQARAAQALEVKAALDRAAYLRARVEYLKRGDLLAILRATSIDTKIDDARRVPIAWFGGVAPAALPPTRAQQRQFAYHVEVAPGSVNARDFHDYCLRWFPTVEDNASTQFGTEQRKVARSIAGVAVVVLNLDAIHLAYDLYRDRAVSDQLSTRVDEVLALAKDVQKADQPDQPSNMTQASQELSKAAAILTVEHVPIGWHDSYIAKRWCAYHDDCDDPTISKPTRQALAVDLMTWVLGLATSWMLLSLGAPFWVSVIEKATGLANILSGSTTDDHKGEERAWYVEGGGVTTSYDPGASSVGLPRQQPTTGAISDPQRQTSGEIALPPPDPGSDDGG